MEITTNYRRRSVIDAWELTATERAEFDYLDWEAIERGEDNTSFVRYRGELIDLGDVPRTEHGSELATLGWDGVTTDSHFSGLAFRYVPAGTAPNYDTEETIVIARLTF